MVTRKTGRFLLAVNRGIGWVQVKVLTITSEADDYASEIVAALKAAGLRAEADLRNEKISYKVREHSVAKVPALFAIGQREIENRTVAVRRLGSKQQQFLPLDEAIAASSARSRLAARAQT